MILLPHERTSEFESRAHAIEKRIAVTKEGRRVQAAHAEVSAHNVRARQAIGSNHFLLACIPDEQVKVVVVKLIEIERLARAFAGRAERDLAKPAEFVQHLGDFDCRRHVRLQVAGPAQHALAGQSRHFIRHVGCG